MMAFIRTVTGDIAPNQLGITYCHEHLLWRPPTELQTQDPDLGLTEVENARKELEHFYRAGGRALIEMTTIELDRDPAGLRRLAEQSGVQIIAATGFNKAKYSQGHASECSRQELAAGMISDLRQGMQGGHIRAGVIKVATSHREATASENKVIKAAGQAHRATGAPISTHTEAGTFGLGQVELLQAAGVQPNRILIGHLDRRLDIKYHLRLARTGAYLGFDQIGKEKYAPDEQRAQVIRQLVEQGFGGQIMLGMDIARKSGWPSSGFGNGPGLSHLLWNFVPRLQQHGLAIKAIRTMLVDNPARWLAIEPE